MCVTSACMFSCKHKAPALIETCNEYISPQHACNCPDWSITEKRLAYLCQDCFPRDRSRRREFNTRSVKDSFHNLKGDMKDLACSSAEYAARQQTRFDKEMASNATLSPEDSVSNTHRPRTRTYFVDDDKRQSFAVPSQAEFETRTAALANLRHDLDDQSSREYHNSGRRVSWDFAQPVPKDNIVPQSQRGGHDYKYRESAVENDSKYKKHHRRSPSSHKVVGMVETIRGPYPARSHSTRVSSHSGANDHRRTYSSHDSAKDSDRPLRERLSSDKLYHSTHSSTYSSKHDYNSTHSCSQLPSKREMTPYIHQRSHSYSHQTAPTPRSEHNSNSIESIDGWAASGRPNSRVGRSQMNPGPAPSPPQFSPGRYYESNTYPPRSSHSGHFSHDDYDFDHYPSKDAHHTTRSDGPASSHKSDRRPQFTRENSKAWTTKAQANLSTSPLTTQEREDLVSRNVAPRKYDQWTDHARGHISSTKLGGERVEREVASICETARERPNQAYHNSEQIKERQQHHKARYMDNFYNPHHHHHHPHQHHRKNPDHQNSHHSTRESQRAEHEWSYTRTIRRLVQMPSQSRSRYSMGYWPASEQHHYSRDEDKDRVYRR